jgi:GNAT superfamily N-acetyltransferase
MSTDDIRELTTEMEWRAAFDILKQLRDGLTEEEYLNYLRDMREEGYRLFALFHEEKLISLAGVAVQTNFYNGRHLFVYDLVTQANHRSEGYGASLMNFVEEWAKEQDCESVTLESGLWRDDAHRFYENDLDMDRYCYTFKKELT